MMSQHDATELLRRALLALHDAHDHAVNPSGNEDDMLNASEDAIDYLAALCRRIDRGELPCVQRVVTGIEHQEDER